MLFLRDLPEMPEQILSAPHRPGLAEGLVLRPAQVPGLQVPRPAQASSRSPLQLHSHLIRASVWPGAGGGGGGELGSRPQGRGELCGRLPNDERQEQAFLLAVATRALLKQFTPCQRRGQTSVLIFSRSETFRIRGCSQSEPEGCALNIKVERGCCRCRTRPQGVTVAEWYQV